MVLSRRMKRYDLILAGGGVAGLSLAYHLVHSPLHDRSVLIVDQDAKDRDDRTLGFWTDRPTPYDDIVYRSWNRLCFAGREPRVVDLGNWRYKVIRGIDFYRFVRQELSAYSNVEFLRGTVEWIQDPSGDGRAIVSVDGQTYAGKWVFDSRFRLSQLQPDPARYHALQMPFEGWVIETPEGAFDPQVATPFDFRTPQGGQMRFFYVLPYSQHRALVEYVVASRGGTDERHLYDQALETYIETILGIQTYSVVEKEDGIIPITDQPYPRRIGRRTVAIGTLGGRVRPCSGYAFTRIQRDSAAIVRSLRQVGHPFDVPPDSRRYRLYDSLLLQVMYRRGEQVKPILAAMVKNNPMGRVFRFLDERATLWEDVVLMASVPPWPFLQALFRLKVLGKV